MSDDADDYSDVSRSSLPVVDVVVHCEDRGRTFESCKAQADWCTKSEVKASDFEVQKKQSKMQAEERGKQECLKTIEWHRRR